MATIRPSYLPNTQIISTPTFATAAQMPSYFAELTRMAIERPLVVESFTNARICELFFNTTFPMLQMGSSLVSYSFYYGTDQGDQIFHGLKLSLQTSPGELPYLQNLPQIYALALQKMQSEWKQTTLQEIPQYFSSFPLASENCAVFVKLKSFNDEESLLRSIALEFLSEHDFNCETGMVAPYTNITYLLIKESAIPTIVEKMGLRLETLEAQMSRLRV